MNDPYYAVYQYYATKEVVSKSESNPGPSLASSSIDSIFGLNPINNYLPAGSESLNSMIHDTKTYGLDITDLIFQDKLKLLGTTASHLKYQIDTRLKLLNTNLSYIDDGILKCENYLVSIEALPMFTNPMVESKRANLSHEIAKLESEKRQEIVRCWSDQVRLYMDLLQTLGEYQTVKRRSYIVNGDI